MRKNILKDWKLSNQPRGLTCRIVGKLDEIDAKAWNTLTDFQYPFLRHEFLVNLERYDCLGERTGWTATHLIFENAACELVAGLPMYLKSNSFGEFVFDWSWADAYHRNGLDYYPKLVVASPFTPATGPRVLIAKRYRSEQTRKQVIRAAIEIAENLSVSSFHLLFTNDPLDFEQSDLLRRVGCQFHWKNQGYTQFSDFTDLLTAKKRKLIRRERRRVTESGIELQRIPGNDVTEQQWAEFYSHYQSTFISHGNFPALTLKFFLETARTMGDQVLLVVARRAQRMIASSYFLVGSSALYGRYWGYSEDVPGLHFEACYYQGIEYCIEAKLARFEPGAQGEHKISRGFLPTPTWSGHWIKEPRFRTAIVQFLDRESIQVNQYIRELNQHSPYRESREKLKDSGPDHSISS